MCPCDIWTIEKVTHGKMNSRMRGSFLSLEGNKKKSVGRVKKKKTKGKSKDGKRQKKKEGECVRD